VKMKQILTKGKENKKKWTKMCEGEKDYIGNFFPVAPHLPVSNSIL